MNVLLILCPIIALGACIDAIAGGGGLITLTAYVAVGLPPQIALGNNKFASASGTAMASLRYMRKGHVHWKLGSIAIVTSLLGSFVGSSLATKYADRYLTYLLLFLVPALALFIILKPDFGQAKAMDEKFSLPLSALAGLILGWYDGFFGPGTGLFLTLVFTSLIGLDLLSSCGTARVVNLASNLAALCTFMLSGTIDYGIAIPCAFSAILGGYLGSELALKGGVKVIRAVMLIVLALLVFKVGNSAYSFL